MGPRFGNPLEPEAVAGSHERRGNGLDKCFKTDHFNRGLGDSARRGLKNGSERYVSRMERVEWLTIEQQQAWRALVEFCGQLVDGMDADVAQFSLTSPDYEVLVHLSEAQDHGLRMSELAHRVLVSKSRLTYRVDRLEARGLVVREPCETDRRGFIARLTPAGYALLTEAAPHHVAGVRRRIVDHLTEEEFLELGRLTRKVLDGQKAANGTNDARPIRV